MCVFALSGRQNVMEKTDVELWVSRSVVLCYKADATSEKVTAMVKNVRSENVEDDQGW